MSTHNPVLAIIPARGGSKSIPRKNIKPLGGFPLIAYSIRAALQSPSIHRVLVSTDDQEIADISRQWGVDVPFLRPPELAQDDTLDLPVFQHALRWLRENENFAPEIVVQLRPTSPFRRVIHIEESIRLLRATPDATAVRAVCVPSQNPYKMYSLNEAGFLAPLVPGFGLEPLPRQSLPTALWHNGYIDTMRSRVILEENSMAGTRILPLKMSDDDMIDLDTPHDWNHAETLLDSGALRVEEFGFSMSTQGRN
jgi:CMP-N,N'-diacetyllegionaminic acid synthase